MEIKFRGHDGERWIIQHYFDYDNYTDTYYMLNPEYMNERVRVTNVCQFTGLKDKYGNEVFKDDILYDEDADNIWVVKFNKGSFFIQGIIDLPGDSFIAPGRESKWMPVVKHWVEHDMKILGNIHEHSHFLENEN